MTGREGESEEGRGGGEGRWGERERKR